MPYSWPPELTTPGFAGVPGLHTAQKLETVSSGFSGFSESFLRKQ